MGVGHYGVFNGSRFRIEIQPRIADFIRKHGGAKSARTNGATKPVKTTGAFGAIPGRIADAIGLTALQGASLPAISKAVDDLTAIIGIGPKAASKLNALGIFEVRQLAELAEDAVRSLDEQLHGRPSREDWFGQARRMTGNGSTAT